MSDHEQPPSPTRPSAVDEVLDPFSRLGPPQSHEVDIQMLKSGVAVNVDSERYGMPLLVN
jgi:hypothetical protein